jgi:hypothetical protein
VTPLRALALDAEGRREEARGAWLQAAHAELTKLVLVGMDSSILAELIACLVCAVQPTSKEERRARTCRILAILNEPPREGSDEGQHG